MTREELIDYMENIEAFSLYSCITTAEGVARRVLIEIKSKFNEEDFSAHYGEEVLNYYQIILKSLFFRRVLIEGENNNINPLFIVLMIRFLFGSMNNLLNNLSFEFNDFPLVSYPCLNRFCNHYRKNVIKEVKKNILYKNKEKYTIGVFKCTHCGFEYRRRGPDKNNEDIYKYSEVVNYGEVWLERFFNAVVKFQLFYITHIATYMEISTCLVYNLIKKYDLSEYVNTVAYKGVKKEIKESKAGILLKEYKKQLLEFVKDNPTYNRYKVSKVLEKEYYYIMKYDLEWLNNIIPANNNRVNDVLYSNEKVFEEKNKIDDTRFLTKIKLLVLNKESNKEKFNMKSICKELKIAYFKMSEGHYPQCKEYIINSSNYFRRNKVKIES